VHAHAFTEVEEAKVVETSEELLGRVRFHRPAKNEEGDSTIDHGGEPARDLTFETSFIETTFARDDHARRRNARGEGSGVGDRFETVDERRAEGSESTGNSSGRTGAFEGLDVNALFPQVERADFLKSLVNEPEVLFANALLMRVAPGTTEAGGHVRGGDDRYREPAMVAKYLVAPESTVGGCRTSEANQHTGGAEIRGGKDQLADARTRGGECLVARGRWQILSPHRVSAFDDGNGTRGASDEGDPRSLDFTEWARYLDEECLAGERFAESLTPVGHGLAVGLAVELANDVAHHLAEFEC
jgi:hypothetical protein